MVVLFAAACEPLPRIVRVWLRPRMVRGCRVVLRMVSSRVAVLCRVLCVCGSERRGIVGSVSHGCVVSSVGWIGVGVLFVVALGGDRLSGRSSNGGWLCGGVV